MLGLGIRSVLKPRSILSLGSGSDSRVDGYFDIDEGVVVSVAPIWFPWVTALVRGEEVSLLLLYLLQTCCDVFLRSRWRSFPGPSSNGASFPALPPHLLTKSFILGWLHNPW